MDIQVFHQYNRLVRNGIADPIVCHRCTEPYVLRATEDAEPVLECFFCGTAVQPSLRVYTRIQAIVKEHYL